MSLPPALLPWVALLEHCPQDTQDGLAGLFTLFERLIGPMPTPPATGTGDPRGYGGISRTGPLERMLLSEWALAEEVPDEFLRRAAEREQQHLLLERESPAVARSCLVFLETSPRLAGGLKIAQLACIFILEKRARVAGASFGWGTRGELFHTSWDRTGWENFARTRTPGALNPELLPKKWHDPGNKPCPPAERWLVGSPDLLSLPHPGPKLILEDPLGEAWEADVTLLLPGAPPRQLRLPLPNPNTCFKLLSPPANPTPFKAASPQATNIQRARIPATLPKTPGLSLQWGRFTNWLAVHASNEVRIYKMDMRQNIRIEKCGTAWLVEGDRVIASGFVQGRFIRVLLDANNNYLIMGIAGPDRRPSQLRRWALPNLGCTVPARPGMLAELHGKIVFWDGNKSLYTLSWVRKSGTGTRLVDLGVGEGSWKVERQEGGYWTGRKGNHLMKLIQTQEGWELHGHYEARLAVPQTSDLRIQEGPWDNHLTLAWKTQDSWAISTVDSVLNPPTLLKAQHPVAGLLYAHNRPSLITAAGRSLFLAHQTGELPWITLPTLPKDLAVGHPHWRTPKPPAAGHTDYPVAILESSGRVQLWWPQESDTLVVEREL